MAWSELNKFLWHFRVWDDYIIGLHCGEEAEKWIQKYLGYEGPSIVVTTNEMAKRDSSLAVKPNYNPAIKGDLVIYNNNNFINHEIMFFRKGHSRLRYFFVILTH